MNTKKILSAFAVATALVLSACAGSQQPGTTVVSTPLDKLTIEKANLISAGVPAGVGEGIASKQQMAYTKADLMAGGDIANAIAAKARTSAKHYYEEAGTDTTEVSKLYNDQMASEIVNGAATIQMITEMTSDGKYKVTVLMAIKPDVFSAAMAEKLKASENEKIRARGEAGIKSSKEELDAYERAKAQN